MRLLIIVLALVWLVIVDQFRFGGYYGFALSHFVARAVRSVT